MSQFTDWNLQRLTTQQDEILAIVRILKVLKAKIEKIEAGL
jgi:hypothetical protein